jgi:aminoglycoside/choline kinase family phosphotransferase
MTLYYQQLVESGLVTEELSLFKRWFDLMGLQRHLKAIGIFSRLHLRDGKSNYLNDIPLTMNYVSQMCQQYPELKAFNQFLIQQVFPIIALNKETAQ